MTVSPFALAAGLVLGVLLVRRAKRAIIADAMARVAAERSESKSDTSQE